GVGRARAGRPYRPRAAAARVLPGTAPPRSRAGRPERPGIRRRPAHPQPVLPRLSGRVAADEPGPGRGRLFDRLRLLQWLAAAIARAAGNGRARGHTPLGDAVQLERPTDGSGSTRGRRACRGGGTALTPAAE